jgi:hypothetical protein
MNDPEEQLSRFLRDYFSKAEADALEEYPVSQRELQDQRRMIAEHFRKKERASDAQAWWLTKLMKALWANPAYALSAVALVLLLVVVTPILLSGESAFESQYSVTSTRAGSTTPSTPKLTQLVGAPMAVRAEVGKQLVTIEVGGITLSGPLSPAPELNTLNEQTKKFYKFARLEGKTPDGARLSAQGSLMLKTASANQKLSQKSVGFSELRMTLMLWPSEAGAKPEEQMDITAEFKRP